MKPGYIPSPEEEREEIVQLVLQGHAWNAGPARSTRAHLARRARAPAPAPAAAGASTRDTLRAGARASSHTHAGGATAATANGGLIVRRSPGPGPRLRGARIASPVGRLALQVTWTRHS